MVRNPSRNRVVQWWQDGPSFGVQVFITRRRREQAESPSDRTGCAGQTTPRLPYRVCMTWYWHWVWNSHISGDRACESGRERWRCNRHMLHKNDEMILTLLAVVYVCLCGGEGRDLGLTMRMRVSPLSAYVGEAGPQAPTKSPASPSTCLHLR